MKKSIRFISLIVFVVLLSNTAKPHCEVPCGIYDDELRIALIKEHIITIAKAMKSINALEAEGDKGMNQMVRWINTKEEHANKIQHITSQYFMTQRIKIQEAGQDKSSQNQEMLMVLHHMLCSHHFILCS